MVVADGLEQVSPDSEVVRASLPQRIVEIRGTIDDNAAIAVISALLFLDANDSAATIHLHLRSTGGEVPSALAVADAMTAVQAPVATRCLDLCGGVAAILLAHGSRGDRSIEPAGRVQLALPHAIDAEHWGVALAELDRLTTTMVEILAQTTGQPAQVLQELFAETRDLDAAQAQELGFVDGIAELLR